MGNIFNIQDVKKPRFRWELQPLVLGVSSTCVDCITQRQQITVPLKNMFGVRILKQAAC
jgi:hypothetical protein